MKLFCETSETARAEALFGGTGALPGTYMWLWSDCLSCMRPRPLSRLTSSWEVDSYCVRYGRRLQLVCHFVMAHDMPSLVLCKIQKPFREEWRPKVDRRRANKIAHNLLYLDRFISRKKPNSRDLLIFYALAEIHSKFSFFLLPQITFGSLDHRPMPPYGLALLF